MKVVESLAMRVVLRTIPIFTIGIMACDLLLPVGMAASVFYALPLLLTFLSSRECGPTYFSIIATALLWIGVFLKASGIPIPYGLFNRMLGTLVLWGVALGLIHYKPVQEGLINAETI